MVERTKEQDECVKFYYNFKNLLHNIEQYEAYNKSELDLKNKLKNLYDEKDKEKYEQAIGNCIKKAKKHIEMATDSYHKIKNLNEPS